MRVRTVSVTAAPGVGDEWGVSAKALKLKPLNFPAAPRPLISLQKKHQRSKVNQVNALICKTHTLNEPLHLFSLQSENTSSECVWTHLSYFKGALQSRYVSDLRFLRDREHEVTPSPACMSHNELYMFPQQLS